MTGTTGCLGQAESLCHGGLCCFGLGWSAAKSVVPAKLRYHGTGRKMVESEGSGCLAQAGSLCHGGLCRGTGACA